MRFVVEATTREVDPMAEFAGKTLEAVKQIARAEGIGEDRIDACDGTDDAQAAVIQLILANRKALGEASAAIPAEKISSLVCQALRVGATEEEVDNSMEQPDLRQCLIALIRSKQAAGSPQRPQQELPCNAKATMDFHVGDKVVLTGSHGEWIGRGFEATIMNIDKDADTIEVKYLDHGSKVWSREIFQALLKRSATMDYQVGQSVVLKGDHGLWIGSSFNVTIMKINREIGTVEVKYSNQSSKVLPLHIFEMLLVQCSEAVEQCDDTEDPSEAVRQLILGKKAQRVDPETLKGMSMKELKNEALGMGVAMDIVDDLDDKDHSKQAAIALILANAQQGDPDELWAMSMKDLKKKPLGMGVAQGMAEDLDSTDYPKQANEKIANKDGESAPIFLCHTKQSSKWECQSFVQDKLYNTFAEIGVKAFFDVVDLPGGRINQCIVAASRCKVLLVVLDDAFPTDWCLQEIRSAIDANIPIQSIFADDKFRWEEVGKLNWKAKGIDERIIHRVFELPAIKYNRDPRFDKVSKEYMLAIIRKVMQNHELQTNEAVRPGHGETIARRVDDHVNLELDGLGSLVVDAEATPIALLTRLTGYYCKPGIVVPLRHFQINCGAAGLKKFLQEEHHHLESGVALTLEEVGHVGQYGSIYKGDYLQLFYGGLERTGMCCAVKQVSKWHSRNKQPARKFNADSLRWEIDFSRLTLLQPTDQTKIQSMEQFLGSDSSDAEVAVMTELGLLHFVIEDESFIFWGMDWGRTFVDIMEKKEPITSKTKSKNSYLKELFLSACRELVRIHQSGWCHLDISPDNVIETGKAGSLITMFIDFGLAEKRDGALCPPRLRGKPLFMAPEVAEDEARFDGKAADIWAMGCMLYQMLSGQVLFKNSASAGDADFTHFSEVGLPRFIDDRHGEVSEALLDILSSALAIDPNQRCDAAGLETLAQAMVSEPGDTGFTRGVIRSANEYEMIVSLDEVLLLVENLRGILSKNLQSSKAKIIYYASTYELYHIFGEDVNVSQEARKIHSQHTLHRFFGMVRVFTPPEPERTPYGLVHHSDKEYMAMLQENMWPVVEALMTNLVNSNLSADAAYILGKLYPSHLIDIAIENEEYKLVVCPHDFFVRPHDFFQSKSSVVK